MRFQKVFQRIVGAGTGTVLGADAPPTGLPQDKLVDNQLATTTSNINSFPIQRVLVAYKGPPGAKALTGTLYMYEEQTAAWYQMGAAKTLHPGQIASFDQPTLGQLASSIDPVTGAAYNPGSLQVCLVVAAAGGDPDGAYYFAVGMDVSNALDDSGEVALSSIAAGAFVPAAPAKGSCYVAAVTNASVHHNLTGTALQAAIVAGRTLLVVADSEDVWYYWSPNAAGDTIDEAATGFGAGATQCSMLGQSMQRVEKPANGTLGLVVKGSGTGKLRISPVT